MELGSPDSKKDGEPNGIGFVEMYNIFAMLDIFFFRI